MLDREWLLSALRTLGEQDDDAIDLGEGALLLAALDRPDGDLHAYRQHLRALAADAAALVDGTASVAVQCEVLRRVLVDGRGYTGDRETYDDLRNANLMHVIDRRVGLPVALGIIYLHVGRSYGGQLAGLNFPSHFLLRVESRGQRAIVDPFDDGRTMGAQDLRRQLKQTLGADAEITPDYHRAVSAREVLVRLQNNIKLRAVAGGDLDRALSVLDGLMAVAPMRTEYWWEAALIHNQRGNIRLAIRTLEGCLSEAAGGGSQERIEMLLRKLRTRLN